MQHTRRAPVAQRIEQPPSKRLVVGSIPTGGASCESETDTGRWPKTWADPVQLAWMGVPPAAHPVETAWTCGTSDASDAGSGSALTVMPPSTFLMTETVA